MSAPPALLSRARQLSLPMTVLAAAMAVLVVGAQAGLAFDDRVLTGAPIWMKALKFSSSILIYALTVVWLLSFVQRRARAARVAATAAAVALGIEMVIIVGQILRGETSHFNVATPLDAALWTGMGITIIVAWLATAALAVFLLAEHIPDKAQAWSLRLGLAISALGMAQGFLMGTPTPAQLDAASAGEPVTILGAHSVGVSDGGPGYPVIEWSSTAGDLRPGHFVGLHGLQAMPLLGWALGRRRDELDETRRVRLVWVGAAGYTGLVVLLTWQALRSQPLLSPDGLTLAALGALVAAVAVSVLAVLRRP